MLPVRLVAEPDDVIATSAPHLVWLHAERKAVMPPLEPDVEEAQRLLDTVPVDYALVDELHFVDLSRRYAKPVLVGHPDLWELVHTDPRGVEIYRRRR